ncbi:hypothetical protein Egran_02669 [Elaphomyces granulatus]|uniref:Nudix hydrolase domain-containing protein n=1 Tax=Elaphomyces granulatus TaxID=519963 RepID=A0A232M0E9_9EURO|nr:hypothetical protein Egran_02669 [Elaphomyces granulatus]
MTEKVDYARTKLQPPSPSSSIIFVSSKNEILLLHRVKTSSSFPSAHVFPGGNISLQDGEFLPQDIDPARHACDDALQYRQAAIRELFEESGILLAKDQVTGRLIYVNQADRERGRHAIHEQRVTFRQWLKEQKPTAEPDTDALIPFTHWITPANMSKRFTTQMYLYFQPFPDSSEERSGVGFRVEEELREEDQIPSSDGGLEIQEARFLPACEWLKMSRSRQVILFPPQFLLLHLVSRFLDRLPRLEGASMEEMKRRRLELLRFVHSGSPPWTQKCILPRTIKVLPDKRHVLALDSPGLEMQGVDKRGETEMVVLVRFEKEGPRDVDVRWKKDIIGNDTKASL